MTVLRECATGSASGKNGRSRRLAVTQSAGASGVGTKLGSDDGMLLFLPRVLRRPFALAVMFVAWALVPCSAAIPEFPAVSVGMPAYVEQLVLPGSELEVIPLTDATALVIRIVNVYPHGTDFRYDLEYYGLVPGDYDLRDFLRRKDGTSAENLPDLPVHIDSVLTTGQVEPNPPTMGRLPWLGGYRWTMIIASVVWVVGLVGLLFWGRGPAARGSDDRVLQKSLADRLRPYIRDAIEGRLSLQRHAELEMMLLTYWRRRLGLQHLKPSESLRAMKAHPEAGQLLVALEQWLHCPVAPESVDIAELLKPYQNVADPVDTDAQVANVPE